MKAKSLGGAQWRIRKLPAIQAKRILDSGDTPEVLRAVDVMVGGRWISLDDDDAVDKYVPTWEILVELEALAYEENFGFLSGWRATRVPVSMEVNFTPAECRQVDSIVNALVSSDMATMKELKSEYSLEEAFQLLEILTVKRINEHKAREAVK